LKPLILLAFNSSDVFPTQTVEGVIFQELNNDQRREVVNTRQRFAALRDAVRAVAGFKGSMTWKTEGGVEYLVRSAYDPGSGLRRQTSLGRRSPDTERVKAEFEAGRERSQSRFAGAKAFLDRQASINRAVGLGRVPLLGARVMRAIDDAGLMGDGLRVVGTAAIYAYEAAAGVQVDPGITATDDLDLLLDARHHIRLASSIDISERSLLSILRRVDRSFERAARTFSAVNRDGFVVDLIKPMPHPPWKDERDRIAEDDDSDLAAVAIDGLRWLENAPPFEAVAIDERGGPLRLVTPDPRAFVIHKLWLSGLANRPPVQRQRDRAQAQTMAQLVAQHLIHLSPDCDDLTALPRELVVAALPLFADDVA